jgi:hypothetical protein
MEDQADQAYHIRLLPLTCRTLNNCRTFVVTFSRNERDARQVFLLMISLSRVFLPLRARHTTFFKLRHKANTTYASESHLFPLSPHLSFILPIFYSSPPRTLGQRLPTQSRHTRQPFSLPLCAIHYRYPRGRLHYTKIRLADG